MLRPWVAYPDRNPPQWGVFVKQWYHWKCFQQWQAHNRREGQTRDVDEDSHFVDADQAYNTFVRYFRRGSHSYTEAAKKLLAKYDFVWPFQLKDDPKQQDKLTTWIEYLGFACAVHCRYSRIVENLQPGYNEAWKTLVDSKVLRPSETEEHVCDIKSAFERQSERENAEAALAAEQKTSHDRQASPRLRAAKELLESIGRRNGLVTAFKRAAKDYLIAKEDVDRHSAKLRWIREQVPLVEAELRESRAAKGGSHTGRGAKRRFGHQKRKRSDQVTFSDGSARPPRRAREPSKHPRHNDTTDDERPPKRLKSHSGPNGPIRAPDMPNHPCDTTRRSRRLAGEPPEFGT